MSSVPGPVLSWPFGPDGYVLDIRPGRGRSGRGPAGGPDGPTGCVLLLSRALDPEFAAVTRLLDRAGVRWARLDADLLEPAALLVDAERRTVRLNGRWLAPTAVWRRHFSPRAIPVAGPAAEGLFRRDSWARAADELTGLSPHAIGASRPSRLAQLAAARQLGVATPRTVITTDPRAGAALLKARRLVVKPVHQHFVEASPGLLSAAFPVVVDAHELRRGRAGGPGPPVIVQEHIDHDAEVRVYWVHGQVLSFEVSKQSPADPWLAPHRVRVHQVDPPGAAASAAALIADALSLRYGAFDFLLRGSAPVFLEVNPDGDWRWAETRAGTGAVTMAAAAMLCRLHRQALAGAGPGGPAAGAFSLLRFLLAG